MKPKECCFQDCAQGRNCPVRLARVERRQGPSIWRKLFGWLLPERRRGFDRRQRGD